MPRLKWYFYLALLSIAVFLTVWLFAWETSSDKGRIQILVSITLTCYSLSIVEITPELVRRMLAEFETAKFREFFGEATTKDDVRLVFAHRHQSKVDNWVTHYKPPTVSGMKPVPEGINAWLAFQDVRAAVYIASTVHRFTNREVKFIHDKDIDHDDFDFTAVSLGLGFNGFTNRLASWCDNKLFKVEWGQSAKGTLGATDNFRVGLDAPSIQDGKDLCIVARIVPRSDPDKPRRICFVCAGRTAAGTAAAGYFLAKNWSTMMDHYRAHSKDLKRDSLAIVVQHTADPTNSQEYDSTAAVTGHISWGQVAGEGRK